MNRNEYMRGWIKRNREKVSAWMSRWRKNNPERAKSIDARSRRKKQRRDAAWLAEIKNKPCMDCHLLYPPECMDFDHRPGTKKLFCINNRTVQGGKARIVREMKKCDLVCSNCHRIRTKERMYRD